MSDLDRDELPVPDYDHLPEGVLETRIRSLDGSAIDVLLAYENAHARRLRVVNALERRLEALDAGATPAAGSVDGGMPDSTAGPGGGSKASPQQEGPPVNPPSQGDPTNPAQPR